MNKDYYCPICNWSPNIDEPSSAIEWEHCPNCLSLIHEESEDELECGGVLEPISVWIDRNDKWKLVHRCSFCGEIHETNVSSDDSPIKIMSIATRPLSMPPFPLEKMNELTMMMGGRGSVEGYYYE
jgi:hypothetical protein